MDTADIDLPKVEITESTENVGNGAYATVMKCHLKDRTECAVKKAHDILLEHCEKEGKITLKDLLMNEAKTMSKMDHPNIVQFKGVHISSANTSSPPNIVMELCQKSLRTYLKENPNVPIKDKLAILRDVSTALCYLHSHKVVHCDLTPNNILLTENFTPKIGDFGSAKVIPDCGKLNYAVPGTASYMPPEALADNDDKCSYDEKLDIYSFGCVMHFVKTGEDFDANETFVQPSKDPLQNLIQQCLKRNPENRPNSSTVHKSLCDILDCYDTGTGLPAHNTGFPPGAFVNSKSVIQSTFVFFFLSMLLVSTNGDIFNCIDTSPIILFPFDKITERMLKITESYCCDFCILPTCFVRFLYRGILSFTAITLSDSLFSIQLQPTKSCSTQTRLIITGLLLSYLVTPVLPANIDQGYCTRHTILPIQESCMLNTAYLQSESIMEDTVEFPLQIPNQNMEYTCERLYPLPELSFSTMSTITEADTSMYSPGHNEVPTTNKIDHTQYTLSHLSHKVLMDKTDGANYVTGLMQHVYNLVVTMECKQICYNFFLNFVYVLQQGFLVENQCTNLPGTNQIDCHVSYSPKGSQHCYKRSSIKGTLTTSHICTTIHPYGCEIKYTSWFLDYDKSTDDDTLGFPIQLVRLIDKDVANDTIPAIIEGSIYLYRDKQYINSNYTHYLTPLYWNHTPTENTIYHVLSRSSMILVSANNKMSLFKFFHVTSSHFMIPGLQRQMIYHGTVYFPCKVVKATNTTEKKLQLTYSKLSQKYSLVHLNRRIYIVNYNKAPVDLNSCHNIVHTDHGVVHTQIKLSMFPSDDIFMTKLLSMCELCSPARTTLAQSFTLKVMELPFGKMFYAANDGLKLVTINTICNPLWLNHHILCSLLSLSNNKFVSCNSNEQCQYAGSQYVFSGNKNLEIDNENYQNEHSYKKHFSEHINLLPFFVVLLVLIFHGAMKYHCNKRIRNIKSRSAEYVLYTRLPDQLNTRRNNTLSLVYCDAFTPSVNYLTQLALYTQSDYDLRSNHFAINNCHQSLSIMGCTLQEGVNRALLRNGYFQDVVNKCFNGHFVMLRKLRVYLSYNADLRCYLELVILHIDGASLNCIDKLHALVTVSHMQRQRQGLVSFVMPQQYFYGRARNNSPIIACAAYDQKPMVPLSPIPFTRCFPYWLDSAIWMWNNMITVLLEIPCTYQAIEHEEHDGAPIVPVSGRTLNMNHLIKDMYEPDSSYKSQCHLTTGRKLDLDICHIPPIDHEDNSQLVSGCSYELNKTHIFADYCGDNASITLQGISNVALEFVAELHQYNQPPLNQDDGAFLIDFEDQSASAPAVEEHNEEHYVEDDLVEPPIEQFDQCLKLKHFITQQGVCGNGQIPERGVDTDKDKAVLPYPVEVTDREQYDIRALRMVAVLQTPAIEMSVFEEADSSSHGSDEWEQFRLGTRTLETEGGHTN